MKHACAALLLLLGPVTGARSADPVPLGQFARWGAFRAEAPTRCYAIAEPGRGGREPRAYLTVSSWPTRRLSGQVHVRFRRPATAASLAVGDRRFALAVRGVDGWPRDRADGPRIVAASRVGDVLRIESRAADGRRSTDIYALAGAASAIDAAGVACLGR